MILRVVRSLIVLVLVSVAILLAVDRLQPVGEDRGSHSVAVAVTLIGTIGLAQLVSSIVRRNPKSWRTAPPLWQRSRRKGTVDTVPAVRELEALIVSAATGGPRARDRLDRRFAEIGCGTLAGRLRSTDPSSEEVLDVVEQLLTEAESTNDR